MPVKAGYPSPLLHASSIENSILFYERLGFEMMDNDRLNPLGWARMHCVGGAIMLLRAEHHADLAEPNLLYLYTEDLPALRRQLIAEGVDVAQIKYPPYMPSGEITLRDPDGTQIFIGHWSQKENDAWIAHIGRSPKVEL
jgi:hypothetical protein